MKRSLMLAGLLVGLCLSAREGQAAKRERTWYQQSDQPLTIFNWRGPGAKKDDCAPKVFHKDRARKGDRVDAPEEPTLADLGRLRGADIVYIRGHGGAIQTYGQGDLWSRQNTFLIGRPAGGKTDRIIEDGQPYRNVNLPRDDDRGPSLAVMWGCLNGRDRFANGLGVNCDSRTKAFVAPKWEVQGQADSALFQCKFFEEFSKGDVSVDEAARVAYEHLAGNSFSRRAYKGFDKEMFVCGNKDLTLDDIRENVEKRKQASPPPSVAPGTSRPPRYVATSSHTCGRYCTNCPKIQSNMTVSPVVTRAVAKKPPPKPPLAKPSPRPSPPPRK